MNNPQVVTVFGNPVEATDSMALRVAEKLKPLFPEVRFEVKDPTENMEPDSDPCIMLDVGQGIEDVVVVTDIKQLAPVWGAGAHDYDVYMELALRQKLGRLPEIRIIVVPFDMEEEEAVEKVKDELIKLI